MRRRALRQRIGVGVGVVERVALAAVAVDRERAVGAGDGCPTLPHAIDSAHRRVSPVSTSVSLPSTLPLALASPANAVLPGLTPDSLTASPALVSATAIGPSLVPVMVMVSVVVEVAPLVSLTRVIEHIGRRGALRQRVGVGVSRYRACRSSCRRRRA